MGKSKKNPSPKSFDLLEMLPTPRRRENDYYDILYPSLPTPTNRLFPSPKSSDKVEKRDKTAIKNTKRNKKNSSPTKSKNKKDQPTLRV